MRPRQIELALARAQRFCTDRGTRLTPIRQRVLEFILKAGQPIRAYTLLAHLEHERGKRGPPTIYRALDLLIAHKLIHKIETSKAFVACSDFAHSHTSEFVICQGCGATEEIRDNEMAESLRRLGEGRGFALERQIIEARGLCPACRSGARRA